MSAATNWEDVYRTQIARIAELERENAALRAELELARFFGRVAERTLNAARKEAQPCGDDPIMRQHLSEGGTPT